MSSSTGSGDESKRSGRRPGRAPVRFPPTTGLTRTTDVWTLGQSAPGFTGPDPPPSPSENAAFGGRTGGSATRLRAFVRATYFLEIFSVKGLLTAWAALSVARTVKVYLPAFVGVPDSSPDVGFRFSPEGRVPDVWLHVSGPVPPVAVNWTE